METGNFVVGAREIGVAVAGDMGIGAVVTGEATGVSTGAKLTGVAGNGFKVGGEIGGPTGAGSNELKGKSWIVGAGVAGVIVVGVSTGTIVVGASVDDTVGAEEETETGVTGEFGGSLFTVVGDASVGDTVGASLFDSAGATVGPCEEGGGIGVDMLPHRIPPTPSLSK